MVRGLVLALCVVACAAYRPSSVSLLEVAVAGPAAAGSESEGGSGSVVSSESEGGSQKPTGATGATGATGGAKQAFAAQKGKPLIKVCIKEKGLSSEDAENQADTQETALPEDSFDAPLSPLSPHGELAESLFSGFGGMDFRPRTPDPGSSGSQAPSPGVATSGT